MSKYTIIDVCNGDTVETRGLLKHGISRAKYILMHHVDTLPSVTGCVMNDSILHEKIII